MAPVAQPAPVTVRVSNDPAGSFATISAIGAAFAGFVSYAHDPDLLATGFAVAITFFGALIALYVLHVAFRLAVTLGKVAIPAGVILLVGCALDWPWAETTMDWLWTAGSRGVEAAEQGLQTWQAR